jgi:hypothetical protein
MSAATTLIPTATGTDQKRTTFHARTIRATQVPIIQKYVLRAERAVMVVGTPHPDVRAGAKIGGVGAAAGRGVRRSVDDGRRRA